MSTSVESGSGLLHRLVHEVSREFAADLPGLEFPADPAVFKRSYGDSLARFEAARVGSPARLAIARALTERTAEALAANEPPASSPGAQALETMQGAGKTGWRIEVPFEGKMVRGRDVLALIERLHADHHLTDAARDGLRWTVEHVESQGGALDLRGHKFALLGAGAELSPAPILLAAGASVLWVDLQRPTVPAAGTLVYAEGASDLLGDPQAVRRAIQAFAASEPVHLGLFAYAPGKGRELRLAEAMNAIVVGLGPQAVRSVSAFVSPTSPAEVQPEDAAVVESRRAAPASWQRALSIVGILKGPGHYRVGAHAASRAVISLQGATYLAAQYLSKVLRAEVLAHDGFLVSANVAGISRTKSLQHPLFQVAFEGAPAFGVRIFDADTTRALATLLMLHDLLGPKRTTTDELSRSKNVHAAQIHGGVYDLPWQFEAAVRAAAMLGAARRPGLLFRRAKR